MAFSMWRGGRHEESQALTMLLTVEGSEAWPNFPGPPWTIEDFIKGRRKNTKREDQATKTKVPCIQFSCGYSLQQVLSAG